MSKLIAKLSKKTLFWHFFKHHTIFWLRSTPNYALRRLKKKLTLEKAKIVCSKTDIQIVEKAQYKTLKVVYNNYMTT